MAGTILTILAVLSSCVAESILPIPLTRIKNQTAYGAEISVGTPPQTSHLLVDTGSYTIGFETAHSNGCQQSNNPCTLGVYDNSTSSTAKWVSNDYGDGVLDHGYGSFINDTLSFALSGNNTKDSPVVLPNFQVGALDTFYASFVLPAPQAGFLGLGQPCDMPGSTPAEICSGYPPSFLNQLYERGAIPRRAFSIYLGKDEPQVDNAMLVINGKDIAKQASAPFTVPMVTPQDMIWTGASPSLFHINVTSFALTSSAANATTTASGTRQPATTTQTFKVAPTDQVGLVDTGNANWYLPNNVWPAVSQYFHISTNSSTSDPYTVDCEFQNADPEENRIDVYFNHDQDHVSIPLASLVSTFGPDQCAVWLGGCGNGLGAPFIRGIWALFDQERFELQIANVRHTKEVNIQPLYF